MPRRPPHFKVFVSLPNHRKTIGVYEDDSLLAMYVRVGMLAVERWADRTGDSFLCSARDLLQITQTWPISNALRKLERLTSATPVRLECSCGAPAVPGRCGGCTRHAVYRLSFPNFAKKQGFHLENRSPTDSTTTTTSTTTSKKRERESKASLSPPPSVPRGTPKVEHEHRCRACGAHHPQGQHPMSRQLAEEEVAALLRWCSLPAHPFTEDQARYATQRVRDWADAGGKRKSCWVATIRNAMTDGWGLKGYRPAVYLPPAGRTKSPEETVEDERQAAMRAAHDRLGGGTVPLVQIEAEAIRVLGAQEARRLGMAVEEVDA